MKLDYSLTPLDFITQAAFELRLARVPFAWLSWLVWVLFVAALLLFSGDALPDIMLVAFVAFICFQTVAGLQRRLWLRRYYSAERRCLRVC